MKDSQTREEYRASLDASTTPPAEELMPLNVRRGFYVGSIVGAVAAPILAVTMPDYAAAIVTASGVLAAAAGVTALANPTKR